jgi:hypothetical protein
MNQAADPRINRFCYKNQVECGMSFFLHSILAGNAKVSSGDCGPVDIKIGHCQSRPVQERNQATMGLRSCGQLGPVEPLFKETGLS